MNEFNSKKVPGKSYDHLSDRDLLAHTALAAKSEKDATLSLLDYLCEVDARRLFTINSYSSLFEYVHKGLGYSEPAAAERVNAVRLMRSVPEVKEHLEQGRLTLTSAAQIQRFIKTEEKVSPKPMNSQSKNETVNACLGQSKREVEKTLFQKQSGPARALSQERIQTLSGERTELKFTISQNSSDKLTQLKDLLGDESLESIFDKSIELLLAKELKARGRTPKLERTKSVLRHISKQEEVNQRSSQPDLLIIGRQAPPNQSTQPAESAAPDKFNPNSRFVPIALKRLVFKRSQGRCEYVNPHDQTRCASGYRLQIDHIYPFALGGKTEFSNLRHLCQNHNLKAAEGFGLSRP